MTPFSSWWGGQIGVRGDSEDGDEDRAKGDPRLFFELDLWVESGNFGERFTDADADADASDMMIRCYRWSIW
jgi:hypothetical protein